MAIICVKLCAEANFAWKLPESMVGTNLHSMNEEKLPSRTYDEEARKMGDYLDILSLTRVFAYGAQSK